MSIKGFVYIMSNKSMPGIIKVGRSTKIPDERAKELSSETSSPTPFVVEYYALFDDMINAEIITHQKLNEYHHGKEFFNVEIPKAIAIIESIKINHIRLFSKTDYDTNVNQFKFEQENKIKEKNELDRLLSDFYSTKSKIENLIYNYPPREGLTKNYSTNEIVNSYNKLFEIFQTLKKLKYDYSTEEKEQELLYKKVLKCREEKSKQNNKQNNNTDSNLILIIFCVICTAIGRYIWSYFFK